jgi:hypothetical protein
VVAAAIAMPVSIVAVGGGIASASNPHTVGTDTIACKTLTGSLSFSPKIDAKGYTSGTVKTKVAATVSGCTVKGSTADTVSKGVVSGTLTGTAGTTAKPAGQCTGLATGGVETGTLTIKWTASSTTAPSLLGVKSTKAGSVGGHGTFTIPGTTKGTASGSFLGSNKGASDTSTSEASLATSSLGATCLKSGLTSLKIQSISGKTAVSLG